MVSFVKAAIKCGSSHCLSWWRDIILQEVVTCLILNRAVVDSLLPDSFDVFQHRIASKCTIELLSNIVGLSPLFISFSHFSVFAIIRTCH